MCVLYVFAFYFSRLAKSTAANLSLAANLNAAKEKVQATGDNSQKQSTPNIS